MKRNFLFKGLLVGMLSIAFVSCSDDKKDEPIPDPLPILPTGAYFLNQGQMSLNVEGSLNCLSYSDMKMENNVFQKANNRSIGSTPQCGVRYGSKIYVGTYESNTIEVIDATTFKSIKQLKLDASTTGTNPRAMVTNKDKIYITMYDGYVARLDTTSLEIDSRVKVGPNPEKPAILNNKLYVPNSDGMNWAVGYGTTASVIDLTTFSVTSTINVPLNPDRFMAVSGKLYLLARGNYYDVPGAIYKIDTNIETLQKEDPDSGYKFLFKATDASATLQDFIYYNAPYDQPEREYGRYNAISEVRTTFTPEEVIYPNAIGIDQISGHIFISSYIMDGPYPSYTAPGYVAIYDYQFNFLKKANIGSGPTCIFFDEKIK